MIKVTSSFLKHPQIFDSVLYYPYINLPHKEWILQALLYYDNIGLIAPEGYDTFGSFTKGLIDSALAIPIYPSDHLEQTSEECDAFMGLISQKEFDLQGKINNMQRAKLIGMYSQKFNALVLSKLKKLGLAFPVDGNNGKVYLEETIALVYMQFLATKFGMRLRFTPATDASNKLDCFASTETEIYQGGVKSLLEGIFPVIADEDVSKILNFKENHYNELKSFRRNIEEQCLGLGSLSPNLRQRSLSNLIESSSERTQKIVELMKTSNFKKILLCGLKIVPAAVNLKQTGYMSLFNLVSAVAQLAEKERFKEDPFYYSALVQREFEKK